MKGCAAPDGVLSVSVRTDPSRPGGFGGALHPYDVSSGDRFIGNIVQVLPRQSTFAPHPAEHRAGEEAERSTRICNRPRDAALDRADAQRAFCGLARRALPELARREGGTERPTARGGAMERVDVEGAGLSAGPNIRAETERRLCMRHAERGTLPIRENPPSSVV